MLKFARLLDKLGVALVFNTGRLDDQRRRTVTAADPGRLPVAGVCLRQKGETLPVGKQRCRNRFIDEGLHADRERRQQRDRLRG